LEAMAGGFPPHSSDADSSGCAFRFPSDFPIYLML
jgi:hypothetical protein